MAGLGETCAHIVAVLFYLEATARIQGKQTCIQRKCNWILPSFLKNVEYLPVKNIAFTSTRKRKRNIDAVIDTGDTVQLSRLSSPSTHERQSTTTTPSDSHLEDFLWKVEFYQHKASHTLPHFKIFTCLHTKTIASYISTALTTPLPIRVSGYGVSYASEGMWVNWN